MEAAAAASTEDKLNLAVPAALNFFLARVQVSINLYQFFIET